MQYSYHYIWFFFYTVVTIQPPDPFIHTFFSSYQWSLIYFYMVMKPFFYNSCIQCHYQALFATAFWTLLPLWGSAYVCPAFPWVLTTTAPGIDILGVSQYIVPWFWTLSLYVSITGLDVLFLPILHIYFFFPVIWIQQLDYTSFPQVHFMHSLLRKWNQSMKRIELFRCIQYMFSIYIVFYTNFVF